MSRRDDDYDDRDDDRRPPKKGGSGVLVWVLVGVGALLLCVCGGGGVVGYFVYQRVGGTQERITAQNNLMQIGLAMHNYHDSTNAFPRADGQTREGKPTLSWRVHLLPYIEQNNLYQRFHLDEPWDSAHNQQILNSVPMPAQYAYGRPKPGQTTTPFRVFLGGGAAFERGKAVSMFGANPPGFNDGTSNTILVVEAADEVPWTKPDELEFIPNGPLPKLGNPARNGFLVLMADASVRMVTRSTSDTTLRAAITRNGNEVLGADW